MPECGLVHSLWGNWLRNAKGIEPISFDSVAKHRAERVEWASKAEAYSTPKALYFPTESVWYRLYIYYSMGHVYLFKNNVSFKQLLRVWPPFSLWIRSRQPAWCLWCSFESNISLCIHQKTISTTFLTHSCLQSPKPPDYFGDISLTKSIIKTYLEEKCWSKSNTQLPFNFFVNLWLIPKLFP